MTEIQNLQAQIDDIKQRLGLVATALSGFNVTVSDMPKKKTGVYAVIEGQNGMPGWVHAYHWNEADWEYMKEVGYNGVTSHLGEVQVGWLVNGPGMVNVPITALDFNGKKVHVQGNLPWVENWSPTNGGTGDRYTSKFSQMAWYSFTEN
jgi:hypothetical protein